MIALTDAVRKGSFAVYCAPNATNRPISAVTGSLAESQYSPFSANRLPRWIATRMHCVGPVLSVSDSSAPSPPGSSGPGLAQQIKGQRQLALFVCAGGLRRKANRQYPDRLAPSE